MPVGKFSEKEIFTMKQNVTIRLHYTPESVWEYKRTIVIWCGDKNTIEARALLEEMLKTGKGLCKMEGYTLTSANVAVEHWRE